MKRQILEVPAELDGERLDKAIAARADMSRGLARRAIEAGGVFVDGRRARMAGKRVHAGQEVRVHIEETGTRAAPASNAEPLSSERIVYRDNELVAVDKPPGIPAQATLSSSIGLPEIVEVTIGGPAKLVHRLDLETSGVTVFGRHKKAVTELARAFREGRVRKTYLAVTLGRPRVESDLSSDAREAPVGAARETSTAHESKTRKPIDRQHEPLEQRPDGESGAEGRRSSQACALGSPFEDGAAGSGTFRWGLAKDSTARGRWKAVDHGGIPALTHWRLLESFGHPRIEGEVSTVRLEPETGRTHQIRVHLSNAGAPILGDGRYGGPEFFTLADGTRVEIPRMMLHASTLSLPHPRTKEPLKLDATLPDDMRSLVAKLGGCVEHLFE